MEPSNNLHPQHKLQEQYGASYSSFLFQPEHKASSTNAIFLESWQPNRDSMYPAGFMSFYEAAAPYCFSQQSADELLRAEIKQDFPDSFPKLSEIMNSPCNGHVHESHSVSAKYKQQQYSHHHDHLGENHRLRNFFSSRQPIKQLHLSAGVDQLHSNNNNDPQNFSSTLERSSSSASSGYNFSHILPSINISNSDLDLNLQAVDLLTLKYDASAASSSQQASQNATLGNFIGELFKESPASSSNKGSAFEDAIQRKKRQKSCVQSKKEQQPPARYSCPPLKVIRKEKLRERIATLQRLVAPYGKTDTASVLTEAIGYIQFLHDQVQTLSVPYMRSSYSNTTRSMQLFAEFKRGRWEGTAEERSFR
ncbi:transcription factor bHLH110 isoform X2 [Manihot esculenta]|uniref:transcription factor bHLH110 isoform X2 n=1 Tax=Manihot esculenta TaxID=3983 RepID=UPI001CC6F507|nr:transcription factor bHLH110 isoform X2 [Manihot esculenta]